jgi:hypothetical protein
MKRLNRRNALLCATSLLSCPSSCLCQSLSYGQTWVLMPCEGAEPGKRPAIPFLNPAV